MGKNATHSKGPSKASKGTSKAPKKFGFHPSTTTQKQCNPGTVNVAFEKKKYAIWGIFSLYEKFINK